jgi:hypothetical protein
MKIINKTPFQDDKGEINLFNRIRATLQYGFNWYPELEAQKIVIGQLEKALGKAFVLFHNQTLGGSGITVPLILLGPPGIYVIHVTHLRGVYWAKGDSWGSASGSRFQPAAINLLKRAASLSRALELFLKRQGLENLPAIESCLMASDPGLHVVSVRPLVRVVMSDAIERFATGFAQARPALSPEAIHELTDRIENPRPPQQKTPVAQNLAQNRETPVYIPESISGSQAIPEETTQTEAAATFDVDQVGFAFQENETNETQPQAVASTAPKKTSNLILGMNGKQLAILGVITAIEICVLIGLIFIVLFNYS